MFEWVWPWVFICAPLPLLIHFFSRGESPQAAAVRAPFAARWRSLSGTGRGAQSSRGYWWWLWLIWMMLVAASARPQWIGEPIELPNTGRDLMLGLDLSGSMQIEDMQIGSRLVSRITAVKTIAADFTQRRKGDRVGLILFGTRAYLQAPLTFDLDTVTRFIEEAQLGFAGEDTAIGDALGLAIKRLRERPAASRILILLTDGQDTASTVDPMEAAALAGHALSVDEAVGLLQDAVDHCKAQSRAIFFGGVKGLEQPGLHLGCHPGSGVLDDQGRVGPRLQARKGSGHGAGDLDGLIAQRQGAAVGHRISGVDRQVQQDLRQLTHIPEERGRIGVEVCDQLHVFANQSLQQWDDFNADAGPIDRLGIQDLTTTERQELVGQLRRSSRRFLDLPDLALVWALGRQALFDEVHIGQDHTQQVVEVVCHAPGETADGFHLCGLTQLCFQFRTSRQIACGQENLAVTGLWNPLGLNLGHVDRAFCVAKWGVLGLTAGWILEQLSPPQGQHAAEQLLHVRQGIRFVPQEPRHRRVLREDIALGVGDHCRLGERLEDGSHVHRVGFSRSLWAQGVSGMG